ncbi:HEPN domain-containing protein [Streptococcus caviae]|uniref:hypothetical protein n=1 Tax=Streptococcus sp. 'caviae' TaxID=1915004 RepID=UPI00094B8F53|nr:hypothetical protein [Streptococcus sp. 'caviae']OLN82746.1 hypothetical protein BMI76_07370 [Streptococcus sp. 'caviae']
MECDNSFKKSKGEIGVSYVTFSRLAEELKNESIIMLQVSASDFSNLGERALASSIEEGKLKKDFDKSSLDLIFTDSKVTSSKMYSAFINYYILRLTAVLELYFKDSIKQLLKLNIDLLAKGFKKDEDGKRLVVGLPKKLNKNYDSKKYLTYLNKIAKHYSVGKNFSKKYKTYSEFLEVNVSDNMLLEKLDNLFALRNDLAHLNRDSDDEVSADDRPQLVTENGFKYSRGTSLSKDNFNEVVENLINLTSKTAIFLWKVETESNLKWSFCYESAECHYARLFKNINQ